MHPPNMLKPLLRLLMRKPLLSSALHTPSIRPTRIYDSIRNEADFHTVLRASTTAGIPLITFWTASYCAHCKSAKPIVRDVIEEAGGLGFVEVEVDAPGGGMGDVGYRYLIRSLPTLLPFVKGESVDELRVGDARVMMEREGLRRWVEEVRREGERNKVGKGWLSGIFVG